MLRPLLYLWNLSSKYNFSIFILYFKFEDYINKIVIILDYVISLFWAFQIWLLSDILENIDLCMLFKSFYVWRFFISHLYFGGINKYGFSNTGNYSNTVLRKEKGNFVNFGKMCCLSESCIVVLNLNLS